MDLQFSDLLQKLEAERNDLSYKTVREQPVRIVEVPKVRTVLKRDREREQKFYHAGRAAQGATDRVALAAALWLEKDLENENR